MKFVIAFATVLAVSSAQFYTPRPQYVRPTLPPQPSPFPPRSSALPPRPSVQTLPVNRVSNNDQNANIVRYDNEIFPDGSYKYSLETDNGIAAQAEGVPRDLGGNPPVVPIVSQGSFSWISPEGQTIAIQYISDENGYQPQGDAIPTPHPIPEGILRALDYIARNPPKQQ